MDSLGHRGMNSDYLDGVGELGGDLETVTDESDGLEHEQNPWSSDRAALPDLRSPDNG